MDYSDCPCQPTPSRRGPRMGVSSLSRRPPPQVDRPLPFASPAAPRPRSPPRMPRTVAGLGRTPGRSDSICDFDRTLSPGSADRTITESISLRCPEASKYEATMEELSRLEFVEMHNIEEDLKDFHVKRRKLIFSVGLLNGSKARKMVRKVASKLGL